MSQSVHWERKHLDNLDWLARRCAEDDSLSLDQRHAFAYVRDLVTRVSVGVAVCSDEYVSQVAAAMCCACGPLRSERTCPGRHNWREPCCLMSSRLAG
jgi:hypothetical protein